MENVFSKCAVIGCNVSYKKQITHDRLKRILSQEIGINDWIGHIDVFFNELPVEIIIGFIKENNIPFAKIKSVYDDLPAPMKGKNFKIVEQFHIMEHS